MLGATDSRSYTKLSKSLYRFSPFIFRHEDLNRLHGNNERIRPSDMQRGLNFYFHLIVNNQLEHLPEPTSNGELWLELNSVPFFFNDWLITIKTCCFLTDQTSWCLSLAIRNLSNIFTYLSTPTSDRCMSNYFACRHDQTIQWQLFLSLSSACWYSLARHFVDARVRPSARRSTCLVESTSCHKLSCFIRRAVSSHRCRPILHINEIEYRLAAWYLFIQWYSFVCLYMSTVQTDRQLNTFLSSDTSRTLILVSFQSSLSNISSLFFSPRLKAEDSVRHDRLNAELNIISSATTDRSKSRCLSWFDHSFLLWTARCSSVKRSV